MPDRMNPEEIAKAANDLTDPIKNRKAIDKLYLNQDDSDLWPIRGKFNCTKRAIKRAKYFMSQTNQDMMGLEYSYLIDSILSEIVNNPKNW